MTGLILFSSCRKNGVHTGDATLQFSDKMITFDTVFTSVSTVTKALKVFNPYKSDIQTTIRLVGGATSYFSINVDGVPIQQLKGGEVEIPAQDSIFIFIKANINPNGVNNPLLACDTLAFTTNGKRQNVELLAYGQDAHFIVIPTDTVRFLQEDGTVAFEIPYHAIAPEGQEVTWKNDKPYVIYGYAMVEQNAKLTIEKGTRVHLHKGGVLWVFDDGCLEVNGTKDEPVTFQGDRLDRWYDKDYSQWDRIWICESNRDSKINYAVIKNAFIGIQAETMERLKNGKLLLTNTVIKSSHLGLLAKTYTIEASNNVFMECVQSCVALTEGGDYTFVNNTICNGYLNRRGTSSLYINNFYEYEDKDKKRHIVPFDFTGNFVNNIVYGAKDSSEFSYSYVKEAKFEVSFENCLLKTTERWLANPITHTQTLLNKSPDFENEKEYDLRLKNTSPCKRAGKSVLWLQTDIEGNIRNTSSPSIGAYE